MKEKEDDHMEILQVTHLNKSYGTGEGKVTALDDVSFSVQQGEFVAIMGPSGSGKSTLLHMLGGVDRPDSGKVLIDGCDIYEMDESALAIFRRRQIGLIYQFYNLIPILNAKENLTLPLQLDGRKPDKDYFDKLVQALGLKERLSHLPAQLSEEELAEVVEKTVAPLLEGGMKNMGRAISAIMAEYKGRVDGKAVSAAVKARLQQAR